MMGKSADRLDASERPGKPEPGRMHPVDKAFYDLTVSQRDRAWREVEMLLVENRRLQAELRDARQMVAKDFWWWDSKGKNDLASLTCPIVISAEDMRTIFSRIEGLERNICRWVNGESDMPSEHRRD